MKMTPFQAVLNLGFDKLFNIKNSHDSSAGLFYKSKQKEEETR